VSKGYRNRRYSPPNATNAAAEMIRGIYTSFI
jgi:hypothetical protein